ncbi:sensor histidine kinase [cf. Phormidesmis sp. LEGE 11477]|uniref:sensor histidine kinase n=1 Tax=cf. Phormidesmis sp. LEGE 11477 TaxID=1828680 RepID=UPI001880C13B|nr:sensor histidine kinase [cf. Phormidesmis sp. LEGE 11477]MBE9061522.1 sensor histidine kinase [cf. Phormidesmis sp. LEGE 11477]
MDSTFTPSSFVVSPSIRKILRWIEWSLLFQCGVSNLLRADLDYLPSAYLRVSFCLLALLAFSLIPLPVSHSPTRRRLYILSGFSLLILVDIAQVYHSSLFDLAIIKACLLLSRRDAIAATVTAVGLNFLQSSWRLPTQIERIRAIGLEPYLNLQKLLVNSFVGTIVFTLFVLLLGFVFVAEQRSRHRAEQLSLEVEALATKLERSRIARDIHDSLGHSLTTLDIQLSLAERYSQLPNSYPKLQKALGKSKQLAAQCLAEARQSLQTMRDTSFDMTSALNTVGEQIRSAFLLNLQVQLPPLPQQLSYQIYLMAKEGLVNIQKHAKATKASLSITAADGQIELILIDDGCGFESSSSVSGYGLQGIRERSQLLGGKMDIHSQPGKGTQLRVIVPLIEENTSCLNLSRSASQL